MTSGVPLTEAEKMLSKRQRRKRSGSHKGARLTAYKKRRLPLERLIHSPASSLEVRFPHIVEEIMKRLLLQDERKLK